MNYRQTYKFREDGLGWQSVLFVVSDDYNEIYAQSGISTDIFLLESVKQDLNTDEGSFAIDELSFTINQAACETDNDLKALFFTLDATDLTVKRYCALFFAEHPSVANLLFIGQIHTKVSGTDQSWSSGNYGYMIDPVREYKFSALSFDISILEAVKISGDMYKIENNDKVRIDNVRERWASGNQINTIFNNEDEVGSLYDILQTYLNYSSAVITELDGTILTFDLIDGNLGFDLQRSILEFRDTPAGVDALCRYISKDESVPATLADVKIRRKLLDPFIGVSENNEAARNLATANLHLSFSSVDNIAELLFKLARSLACYVLVRYTAGTSIEMTMTPRSGLVEDDFTYLIGVEDADFDSSSVLASNKNEYYAVAHAYAAEGKDESPVDREESEKLKSEASRRQDAKESRDIAFDRLLLSISLSLLYLTRNGFKYIWRPLSLEYLHTAIYVEGLERKIGTSSRDKTHYLPAYRVLAQIAGKNVSFDTLSEYVNAVMARDQQYYETEYNLTVPFWNGFSKSSDGTSPSWQNIKLGSKIKLSEEVQRYSNGTWTTQRVVRDFVVVGIERNLQTPETKLKLHNLERFAYGYWDGEISESEPELPAIQFDNVSEDDVKVYQVSDDSPSILSGDAVMIMPDGTISKARNRIMYYGRVIGVALETGEAGDFIRVQIAGEVFNDDYNFDTLNFKVFMRESIDGLNISEECLNDIEGTEDVVVELGKITSAKSFILDINEMAFDYEIDA